MYAPAFSDSVMMPAVSADIWNPSAEGMPK
jgi:hypothetical protein